MRIYSNKFTVTLGEYKYHKIQTGVELKAYERLYDKANQYSFSISHLVIGKNSKCKIIWTAFIKRIANILANIFAIPMSCHIPMSLP